MRAEDRLEALTKINGAALEALADEILAAGVVVSVVGGPEAVSAPVRVGVPGCDTTVVLGHVALTRCSVTLDGTRGDGMRTGYDLAGAVAAAVCDAESERHGPFAPRVRDLCEAAEREDARRRAERASLVAATTLEQP